MGKIVVATYRTSCGLKQGTLELRAHKTFHAGSDARQIQTTPDGDYNLKSCCADGEDDGNDDDYDGISTLIQNMYIKHVSTKQAPKKVSCQT